MQTGTGAKPRLGTHGFAAALFLLTATVVARAAAEPAVEAEQPKHAGECVVLLHGLGRTDSSMRKIEELLSADGYAIANVDYESRSAPIEQLSADAITAGLGECREAAARTVHFVTHSLGGILLRYYLEDDAIAELGRSVMLGPPNQGSEAADVFRKVPGYRLINGDAGQQLGTDEDSVPLQLGPVRFDVGIIAGDRTIDPVTSQFLPNPDDGKVSVENTKVAGMNDFLLVHHSHAMMMRNRDVIRQIAYYLDHGEFDYGPEEPETVDSDEEQGSAEN